MVIYKPQPQTQSRTGNKSTIREGLESQVQAIQAAMDDASTADSAVCITCYSLAEDCLCGNKQVLWPNYLAISLLRSLIGELK